MIERVAPDVVDMVPKNRNVAAVASDAAGVRLACASAIFGVPWSDFVIDDAPMIRVDLQIDRSVLNRSIAPFKNQTTDDNPLRHAGELSVDAVDATLGSR